MRTIILAAVLTFVAVAGYAETMKTIYKVSKLSVNEVAVSCNNGADPTTYPKLHGMDALIISCGE